MTGALGGRGDEHLGGGDDLETGGVVLTDPRLVEAELVQTGDQLEVALERQSGVLSRRVKGGQEHAEAEGPIHGAVLSPLDRAVNVARRVPPSWGG